MLTVGLVGLFKMELPGSTVRLCDGGYFKWDAETFENSDPVWGSIVSMEPMSEGLGDDLPGLIMGFGPSKDATAAELIADTNQGASAKFWIAEYDAETGELIGTPELHFSGEVDRNILESSRGSRICNTDIISKVERLLLREEANSMSPRFHKTIWPGELGMDNAVDLLTPVAWGTEDPRGSGVFRGSGGGSGNGTKIINKQ